MDLAEAEKILCESIDLFLSKGGKLIYGQTQVKSEDMDCRCALGCLSTRKIAPHFTWAAFDRFGWPTSLTSEFVKGFDGISVSDFESKYYLLGKKLREKYKPEDGSVLFTKLHKGLLREKSKVD